MSMKAEELISRKCHNIESKSLSGHLVVIDKVAFEAIEMARMEEREKAIELHMKYCGNYRCPSNKQSFGNNQCSGNCLIMKDFRNDLEL